MEEVICSRCIMNNTTRFFKLSENGICNYCEAHDQLEKQFPIIGNEKKLFNLLKLHNRQASSLLDGIPCFKSNSRPNDCSFFKQP